MNIKPIKGALSGFVVSDFPLPPNRGILDPVTVILQDFGDSRGRIIVSCFDSAWSAYFGNTGTKTLAEFIAGTHPGYLANCLVRNTVQGANKTMVEWVENIERAVVAGVQQQQRDIQANEYNQYLTMLAHLRCDGSPA